jgi:hypothetical protein
VAASSGPAGVITCANPRTPEGVSRCADLAVRLGHTRLVVDLGAGAIDSALLSTRHRYGKRLRDAGGRLAVVCSDSRLRRLLDVTLLSAGFTVYATRDEALAR